MDRFFCMLFTVFEVIWPRRQPLSLLHNCHQDQHFNSALEHYNRLMVGTGQAQYAHACHDCLKIIKDEQGNLSEQVFLYPYIKFPCSRIY